ncbi:MAG TPA: DUF2283 domain-containing protein [Candidatus Acidoferrales bacterium]|nr:DUF2283 domain-containing protein [Candidatus Acidoferrales bacterium]
MGPRIIRHRFDREADAIYIWLSESPYSFGTDLDEERRIDFDHSGKPRGIELTAVSSGVDIDGLPCKEDVAALLEELKIRVYA